MGLPKERWEEIRSIVKNPGRQFWDSASLGPVRRLVASNGRPLYVTVKTYWREILSRLKKA